jgi:hypothetical protein
MKSQIDELKPFHALKSLISTSQFTLKRQAIPIFGIYNGQVMLKMTLHPLSPEKTSAQASPQRTRLTALTAEYEWRALAFGNVLLSLTRELFPTSRESISLHIVEVRVEALPLAMWRLLLLTMTLNWIREILRLKAMCSRVHGVVAASFQLGVPAEVCDANTLCQAQCQHLTEENQHP